MSTIVDERGRVFGRINLIDAAAALFLFVLIPVAFSAYLLFRTPPVKLTAVTPNNIYHGPNHRVVIHGVNLRPFMRVAFGTNQGVTFAITSTTSAEIEVPELPPGIYDVVLYDYRQEVDRLPKALTVLSLSPVPLVAIDVEGSFMNLDAASASQLHDGQKLTNGDMVADVLHVGALAPSTVRLMVGTNVVAMPVPGAKELPATVRVRCYTVVAADGTLRCMVQAPHNTAAIAPDSVLTLPGPQGWVNFQIRSASLPSPPPAVEVRVAFAVNPEIVALVKPGDTDSTAFASSMRATIVSVNRNRTAGSLEATLRVPAVAGGNGWHYNNEPIKAGLPFRFETATYVIQGQVLSMKAPEMSAR